MRWILANRIYLFILSVWLSIHSVWAFALLYSPLLPNSNLLLHNSARLAAAATAAAVPNEIMTRRCPPLPRHQFNETQPSKSNSISARGQIIHTALISVYYPGRGTQRTRITEVIPVHVYYRQIRGCVAAHLSARRITVICRAMRSSWIYIDSV